MRKLEELIQEYCPEGVIYKTLGDIATDVFRGSGITREQVRETGTPCVRYGEIYTTYGIWFEDCVSHTDESLLASKKYFGYGDILFAITGESVDDIAKCCAYIGHETCLAGGDVVVLKHNEDPKYLSYALSTLDAQKQKSKGKVKSKVVHSSVPDIKSIRIPVPPLEVQHEIVRILDTFTELTSELTENLSKELTARKQQYEYYRNKLLDKQQRSTKIITIGELGAWSGGKTPSMDNSDYWENGTIPWISSKDMKASTLEDTEDHITEQAVNEAAMTVYPANGIAVVTRSGILKHTLPVAFVPFETTVNQDIKMLTVYESVLPRYAFHAIQGKSPDILTKAKKQGGTVDSLEFKKFLDYKIPLPSLAVQQRLVEVLDNFDAICSDLNIGLPAEIEARKKQYEFYRDQLLTFAAQDEIVLTDRQTDEYNALILLCQYVFGYVSLKISDICNISRGKVISKTDIIEQAGTYPVYSSQTENNGELGKIDSYMFDGEYVTWTTDGANAGTVFYRYGKFNITNVCGLLSVMDSSVLLEKYLFYFLQKNAGKYVNAGMGNPKLMSNVMASIKIDIPSLSEQKRIIAILDHFSTLCTDLTSGLPAEIEARQKQYEYYRDNLLSFTPAD